MNTTSPIKLGCLEGFFRCLLDDWIAPNIPTIKDFRCLEPRIRKRSTVLDIPGVTQVHTYTCGATASWSVLNGMGWDINITDWLKICHESGLCPDEGMDADQLAIALKRVGAKIDTRKFRSKKQITKLIDAGQPVLFGWDDEMFADGDHWMYVYGYEKNYLFVGNEVRPGRSQRLVSWGEWRERLAPKEIYVIEAV